MIPPMRATALAPKWWMMVTRGALALAFGGAISLWPNPTLPFVVVLFASYAMLDGAWAIAAAVSVSQRGRWLARWPVALGGQHGDRCGGGCGGPRFRRPSCTWSRS